MFETPLKKGAVMLCTESRGHERRAPEAQDGIAVSGALFALVSNLREKEVVPMHSQFPAGKTVLYYRKQNKIGGVKCCS